MKGLNLRRIGKLAFLATIISITVSAATHAATCHWVGSAGPNNQWNDAGNWSSSEGGAGSTCDGGPNVPGSSDSVVFDSGSAFTPDLTGNISLVNMTLASDFTGDVDMETYDLDLSGILDINPATGSFTGGSGTIDVNEYGQADGDVTLGSGAFTVDTTFRIYGLDANAVTFTAGSGSISVTGDVNLNTVTLTNWNHADVDFTNSTSVSFGEDLLIGQSNYGGSGGTIDLSSSTTTIAGDYYLYDQDTTVNHNSGEVEFDGTSHFLFGSTTFEDLTFTSGNFTIDQLAVMTANGTTTWSSGRCYGEFDKQGMLNVAGPFSYSSDYADGDTCLLQLSGANTYNLAAGGPNYYPHLRVNNASAVVNLTGSGTVDVNSFDFYDGQVNQGSIRFEVDGAWVQSGGDYNGGSNTINVGTSMQIYSYDDVDEEFTAGTGSITVAGDVTLNKVTQSNRNHADIDFSTASALNFNEDLIIGETNYGGSGGYVDLTANTTTIAGDYYLWDQDTAVNHNNGEVDFDGSSHFLQGPTTFYDLTFTSGNFTLDQNMVATVNNATTWTSGRCYGEFDKQGVLNVAGTYSYSSDYADGDSCVLQFSGAQTYNIPGGSTNYYPHLRLNGASTIVTLTGGNTLNVNSVDLYNGTFNQGSTILEVRDSFEQRDGSFNGGSGSISIGDDLDIYGYDADLVEFTSGSGAISITDDAILNRENATNRNHADVDFISTSLLTVGDDLLIGESNYGGSGGTIDLSSTSTKVVGDYYLYDTDTAVNHNSGLVEFDGTSHFLQGNTTFNNLTFTSGDFTIDQQATITSAGTLTWAGGRCYGEFSNQGTLQSTGTYTRTYSDYSDGDTCVLILAGTTTQTVNIPTGSINHYPYLRVNNPNITVNTTGSDTIQFNYIYLESGTFSQGTANINSVDDFYMNGGTFTGGTGTMTITDDFNQEGGDYNDGNGDRSCATAYVSAGTFDSGTGTWVISEDLRVNAVSSWVSKDGVADFTNTSSMTVSGDIRAGESNYGGSSGSLTLPSGTLDLAGEITETSGTTINGGGGDLVFSGTNSVDINYVDNLASITVNKTDSTDYVRLDGANLSLTGNVIIKNGVLNSNNRNITLGGYFMKCPSAIGDAACQSTTPGDASFTPSSNRSVTLNGSCSNPGSPTPTTCSGVYGDHSATFYDLIKQVTTADTIYFEGGEETRVTNNLTLTGVTGELLDIRSTNSTPAELNAENLMTVDYVRIRTVDNTRAAGDYDLSSASKGHTENIDLGLNNQGWIFDSPYVVTAIPEFSTWIYILTMLFGMGFVIQKNPQLIQKIK